MEVLRSGLHSPHVCTLRPQGGIAGLRGVGPGGLQGPRRLTEGRCSFVRCPQHLGPCQALTKGSLACLLPTPGLTPIPVLGPTGKPGAHSPCPLLPPCLPQISVGSDCFRPLLGRAPRPQGRGLWGEMSQGPGSGKLRVTRTPVETAGVAGAARQQGLFTGRETLRRPWWSQAGWGWGQAAFILGLQLVLVDGRGAC